MVITHHFCAGTVTLGKGQEEIYMVLSLDFLDVSKGQVHVMNCWMSFLGKLPLICVSLPMNKIEGDVWCPHVQSTVRRKVAEHARKIGGNYPPRQRVDVNCFLK